MDYKDIIIKAIKAREEAYAPYSNYKVGSAVVMEDDSIYTGCNIENASYGASNCAERTAIFKAISEGHIKIKIIVVVGDMKNYTYPCGICRQVIQEFCDEESQIILAKDENNFITKTINDILPGAFSKSSLGK